jgi:hypothetical protein
MRPFVAVLVGLATFLQGTRAAAQSLADLAPAKTLAYVELQQPAELAKELAALMEGSYLANVPDSLAPLYAKAGAARRHGQDPLAMIGVALAPEMFKEFGRIKGAAVAITGIDKEEGMPEFLVIVQPGESNMPGLMMRMFVASFMSGSSRVDGGKRTERHGAFERAGETEGVGLYRYVERRFEKNDEKPMMRVSGPALAQLPDMLLIGSPELVKQTIRRAKKKDASGALSGVPAFRKAQDDTAPAPGLFAYANPPAVMEMIEQLGVFDARPRGKGKAPDAQQPDAAVEHANTWIHALVKFVNPKALVAVADQLSLRDGTLHYRRRVYLDAKEKSPLVELLPKGPVPQHLLDFAAPDSLLFAAVANDDGEKRWQRLLDFVDGLFKGGGDRDLPSRAVAEFERGLGLSIGKDVLGKIRGVGVAMASVDHLMKGLAKPRFADIGPPMVLLVDAVDETSATRLAQDIVPKLFAAMSHGREVADAERTVAGHKLRVLEIKNRGYSLSYGREGTTLVLGPDESLVAMALTQGQKKQGLRGDATTVKRLRAAGDPFAVCVMRPATTAAGAFAYLISSFGPGQAKVHVPKEAHQLFDLIKTEKPVVLTLTRTSDYLAADASYPGLRPLLARVTNFFLEERFRAREAIQPRPDEAKEVK